MPAQDKIPELLLTRLQELFKSSNNVEVAFYTQIYIPSKREPPHPLIAIKSKDFNTVNSQIGQLIKQELTTSQFVDVLPMDNFLSSWMNQSERVRVFYRRN